MNTRAHFIAGLVGPMLLAMSLSILLNGEAFRSLISEFGKSPALIFLTGIITMLGGLAIVRLHNVWTGGSEVIVTIFGWLATIGGLVRILWPRQMSDLAAGAAGTSFPITVFALLPLVLGAYLSWQGWRHCLDQR